MNDEEPHRVEDNDPPGEQPETVVRVEHPKILKVIVRVGFDEHLKEFHLWDYLYDVDTEHFELEATSDYKNRIQYYEVAADAKPMKEFMTWLLKSEIKFKLGK